MTITRTVAGSMLAVALAGSILGANVVRANDANVQARNDGRLLAPVLLSVEIVPEERDDRTDSTFRDVRPSRKALPPITLSPDGTRAPDPAPR